MREDDVKDTEAMDTELEEQETPDKDFVSEDSEEFTMTDELPEVEEPDFSDFDAEAKEDELFNDLNRSLKQQLMEMDETGDVPEDEESGESGAEAKVRGGKVKKVLLTVGCILLVVALAVAFLVGTKSGQKVLIRIAAHFIEQNVGREENNPTITGAPDDLTPGADNHPTDDPEINATPIPIVEKDTARQEDYVRNILIFGIDQGSMDSVHSGSLNTDTIMIATINTKTQTVSLTSVLRDTYVELNDGVGRKINSVYARGNRNGQGPQLLMHTLEEYFCINIDGYVYVKLESFEKVVDLLGGVTIKLTQGEADYLNTTNYITNPANRNLVAGNNHMNGNQVAGYCRIRKVATVGGASNDYGRTLRQRRVLSAIFERYKSQSIVDLMSVTQKCLSYVYTDLDADQIAELMEMFVYNNISTMESYRLPLNDTFYDSGKSGYNGVTYGLVITDIRANICYMYEHLYGDTPEEAQLYYDSLQQ